jgi:hypothetical protein
MPQAGHEFGFSFSGVAFDSVLGFILFSVFLVQEVVAVVCTAIPTSIAPSNAFETFMIIDFKELRMYTIYKDAILIRNLSVL